MSVGTLCNGTPIGSGRDLDLYPHAAMLGDTPDPSDGRPLIGLRAGPRQGRVLAGEGASDGLVGMSGVLTQGGGDVVPAGQAQDPDRRVAQGGHDLGVLAVRTWERSSSKVTSRT